MGHPHALKYNPNQPRDPGGEHGGQWTSGGAGGRPSIDGGEYTTIDDDAASAVLSYQGGQVLPSVMLRAKKPLTPGAADFIKRMDTAMSQAGPVGKRVRVFRGVSREGKQSLGVDRPEDLVGETVVDRGFGSTSANVQTAEMAAQFHGDGNVVWTLDVDPAVKAVYLPRVPGALATYAEQEELVLERGTRWVVTAAEGDGQQWRISARVLPPDAASLRLPPAATPAPPSAPPASPKPARTPDPANPWGDLA
jgi:hypothetical protein